MQMIYVVSKNPKRPIGCLPFVVLDGQDGVACPSSSKGCVNMLHTTRPLKTSPKGQSPEFCVVFLYCIHPYISKVVSCSLADYDKTSQKYHH